MTDALRTSVVGSHARPSWFVSGIDAAERGEFGPADLAEMLDDGVDLALRDQEDAGIDLVTDGEMRRAGFFTAEFYRHLSGLRALPADRQLGAGAMTSNTDSRSSSRSPHRTGSGWSRSSGMRVRARDGR
jgi:methionine synthase II (cobalamin-independent)